MTALSDAVADRIEPDARDMIGRDGATDELVALASLAISFRRIADAFVGDEKNSGVALAIHHLSSRS